MDVGLRGMDAYVPSRNRCGDQFGRRSAVRRGCREPEQIRDNEGFRKSKRLASCFE